MAEVGYVINAKAKEKPQVYEGVDCRSFAQACDLFNTSYSLGNTIRPICAGLIKNAADWSTMSWSLGLIGGLTAVPVALWSGRPA